MPQIIRFLAILGVCVLSSTSIHADPWGALAPDGGKGLYRVQSADAATEGTALAAAHVVYMRDKNLFGTGVSRFRESIAVTAAFFDALEVAATASGQHPQRLKHDLADLGYFGDFGLRLKYEYEPLRYLTVAPIAGMRFLAGLQSKDPNTGQTIEESGYADTASPEFIGAVTFHGEKLEQPIALRAHLNGGYIYDNSCRLIEYQGNPCTSSALATAKEPNDYERFAWSMNLWPQWVARAGVETWTKWFLFFAEFSTEQSVVASGSGPRPKFLGSPVHAAGGIRVAPLSAVPELLLTLAGEYSPTDKPYTGVPVQPLIEGIFGVQYALDGPVDTQAGWAAVEVAPAPVSDVAPAPVTEGVAPADAFEAETTAPADATAPADLGSPEPATSATEPAPAAAGPAAVAPVDVQPAATMPAEAAPVEAAEPPPSPTTATDPVKP